MDADKLASALIEGAKTYIDAAIGPLVDRIKELEGRPMPEDGKDADPDETKAIVAEALSNIETVSRQDVEAIVSEAIKLVSPVEMPRVPDADEIAATVAEAVKAAVAQLPPPEPGKSITLDDVRPMLEEAITKAVAALPVAKDGVGLAGGVIDREGRLTLTLTDGKAIPLGVVVGEPGKPGRDGFGFDDLSADFDGERTVTLRFQRAESVKEFPIVFPVPVDRGVYRPENTYAKGDFVSFGGSGFIAQRETSDKPETSDAWRLSVKRGRDGKDGQLKPSGPSGPVRI
jgi:hypothetical protein